MNPTTEQIPTPLTDELNQDHQVGIVEAQLSAPAAYRSMLHHARDLERKLAIANERVKELSEAWNEMRCCDDVPLEQNLAASIANLRKHRDALREDCSNLSNALKPFGSGISYINWGKIKAHLPTE